MHQQYLHDAGSFRVTTQVRVCPKGQFNWLTGAYDRPREQLVLDWAPFDADVFLPQDNSVMLLATENGAQLLISGFGLYVGKKSERVIVKQGGHTCAQVPFLRMQELLVVGRGVTISSDLIQELCARGIRIGFLTSAGKPSALVTSPLLTATVAIRRAQLLATESESGAEFARRIVAGKLRNQERMLRYLAKSRTGPAGSSLAVAARHIDSLAKQALQVPGPTPAAVRGNLMGLEGTGGRIYWSTLAEIAPDFDKRRQSASDSPVNGALNYGYGILYSHVWGATMNAGLEPFAGFLHTDRSGKPSLVLDLVEEFRQPIVDRAIFGWINRGGQITLKHDMLDAESREAVAARVLQRLNAEERFRGRTYQVRSIIQMQARRAAAFFRGNGTYRAFTFSW